MLLQTSPLHRRTKGLPDFIRIPHTTDRVRESFVPPSMTGDKPLLRLSGALRLQRFHRGGVPCIVKILGEGEQLLL
jgi:hypothetical protein